MKALQQFEKRVLMANLINDPMVPYCTAALVPYLPSPSLYELLAISLELTRLLAMRSSCGSRLARDVDAFFPSSFLLFSWTAQRLGCHKI